jgi:ribonucleotide monophosphatase NagD (HAD superfamily)
MLGVLTLNICLFYLLNSVSWENICKQLTAYHDLVNEMSFRKHIYHLQISKSNYNPTINQYNYEEILQTQAVGLQSDTSGQRGDILQQISAHPMMRSSHQDFTQEQ